MYSVRILGSVRHVSCKFHTSLRTDINFLARTPVYGPVPRDVVGSIPILTGMFEEHRVILATRGPSPDMNLWSFNLPAEDVEFVQKQMNLPICVLSNLDQVEYFHHYRLFGVGGGGADDDRAALIRARLL